MQNTDRLYAILLLLVLASCTTKYVSNNETYKIAKSLKAEKQIEQYACGVAALVSKLDYWDIKVQQAYIIKHYPPRSKKAGYSLNELKQIAIQYEIEAFVLQGNKDFLEKQILLGRPLIIPLFVTDTWGVFIGRQLIFGGSYNHYVVAYGFSKKDILIMDPDKGFETIPSNKFFKMWEVNKQMVLLIAK